MIKKGSYKQKQEYYGHENMKYTPNYKIRNISIFFDSIIFFFFEPTIETIIFNISQSKHNINYSTPFCNSLEYFFCFSLCSVFIFIKIGVDE